jgi:hypothetical protein
MSTRPATHATAQPVCRYTRVRVCSRHRNSLSHVSQMTLSVADLRELAGRFDRLCPDWRDQRRFYEWRSDLVADLCRLAREASR